LSISNPSLSTSPDNFLTELLSSLTFELSLPPFSPSQKMYKLIFLNELLMLRLDKTLIALILICAINGILTAQKVYKQNAPSSNCYCEMIFEETATSPRGVVVIDVKDADIKTYSRDNKYRDLQANYNLLYIKLLNQGSAPPMQCYDAVITTISATDKVEKSVFYVIENPTDGANPIVKKGSGTIYPFNVIYDMDGDLGKLRRALDASTLNSTYAIPVNTFGSDPEWIKRMENYKGNHDVGIHIAPLFLTGAQLGIEKGAISPYGLSYAKNIGKQSTVKVGLSGFFKLPDTKSLQSGMQSRMFSALQSGEKAIYLDEKLSGNIMFGSDVTFKYQFAKTKAFRPYVAAGLGAHMLINMSGSLKDTIDISNIDLNNPSSLQGAIGGDLGGSGGLPDGMSRINTLFIAPQVELGFDFRLSPVTKVNISMPFKYYMDMSKSGLNTFAWGFNFGLSFTLNPRKLPKPLNKPKKAAIAAAF
jgi:hypothetical protein